MTDTAQTILDESLTNIIETYWIVRVLREWEKAKWQPANPIGEREILALIVLEQGGKQEFLERELGGILGLPTSTTSDLVQKLVKLNLVERAERGGRDKPLTIARRGKATLTNARRNMCDQYRYLFAALAQADQRQLQLVKSVTGQFKNTAIARLKQQVQTGESPLPPAEE